MRKSRFLFVPGPIIFLAILWLAASRAVAQDMSPEEFAARAASLGQTVNSGGVESSECLELKRRVEELKGRPQLRYSAMQQYKTRCGGPSEPLFPASVGTAVE